MLGILLMEARNAKGNSMWKAICQKLDGLDQICLGSSKNYSSMLKKGGIRISIITICCVYVKVNWRCTCTVFENHSKSCIWIFDILAFSTYFWPFSMNFCPLNVARFAHNVEWDFFCDFQTLCTCGLFMETLPHKSLRDNLRSLSRHLQA